MVNPYLEKSVATTKKLQVIITRMVEFEKDIQDYVDSADYPAEKLAQFMDEQENPYTEEIQLLAIVNDLLYRLMIIREIKRSGTMKRILNKRL